MKNLINNTQFTAEQLDTKPAPWAGEYRPHWKLTLNYGGHKSSFDFWNNIYNKTPEKIGSMSMLLNDAIFGLYDIDEFSKEFGYTKISECLRVYRGCRATLRKIKKLYNVNNDDIYKLADALNKLENS